MSAAEFRSLPDDPDAGTTHPLPLDPATVTGTLSNGLRYFIGRASKPKARVAMALAVAVGSLAEEDHEQGVAHILEHLAFNATEKYNNHDIIRFLESIGAEFGACQNAHTSFDETVYELVMPTEDLEKGLSVFAQFAAHIRCDAEGLCKERGAVLDEWRGTRSAEGRASETDWKIMCQGCKYAERLPIGLESIIRNVPADTIKAFYKKWYTANNMAVVLMGDMEDLHGVVDLIEKHLGHVPSSTVPNSPPRCPLPEYGQPRYHTYLDRESQESIVQVIFQRPAPDLKSAANLKDYIVERIMGAALNNRLYKLSRKPQPPFYVAMVSSGSVTKTIYSGSVSAVVEETGHEVALEALLVELARAQQHGFGQQELDAALSQEMAEAESSYKERNQLYAIDMRDEYVRHYITGELAIGMEKEARLTKTILKSVTTDDLLREVKRFDTSKSCVIKAASHKRAPNQAALQAVVERVEEAKRSGGIDPPPSAADQISIIDKIPEPGKIVGQRDFPFVQAKEMTLENGMKVCLKSTQFLEDQVLITGTADGGLSELDREEFRTCVYSFRLASEIGQFGHPPEALSDALMGKRVEVSLGCGEFNRQFMGEQSPKDLETCFQLIHRLFTHDVHPDDGDLSVGIKFLRETLQSEERNPLKAFSDRVRFINRGKSYLSEPMTVEALDKVDPKLAFQFYNECFKNPAQFDVCITGSFQEELVVPLIEKYLASIPKTDHPKVIPLSEVRRPPGEFPASPITEDVRTTMIAPQGQTLITVPISLPCEDGLVVQGQMYTAMLCSRLLENRLLRLLRFQHGEVYGVQAGTSWKSGGSDLERFHGEVAIHFTCEPSSTSRLSELALSVLENLQASPCNQEELDSLLSIELREWEEQQEENTFWHSTMVGAYGSRFYRKTNDVDGAVKRREQARTDFRKEISPEKLHEGFCSIFPCPVRSRYTAITFSPRLPLAVRVLQSFSTTQGKILWSGSCLALVSVAAWILRKMWRRAR